MYQLSLEKVEKKIEPYFRINIENNKANNERLFFSDNLQDLKEALVELKRNYDTKVKEIPNVTQNPLSNNYFSIYTSYKSNLYFDIKIDSKKAYKKEKKS